MPQDQLDRVKVPAGLDLGRTSHREIAVAILAELVQLRAAGEIAGGTADAGATSTGATSTGGSHAGHGRTSCAAGAGQRAAAAAPAEAVDPVCGMTVVADDSSYPLVHDGVTYYFCRAGCRRAFEADPAAYVKKGTRC